MAAACNLIHRLTLSANVATLSGLKLPRSSMRIEMVAMIGTEAGGADGGISGGGGVGGGGIPGGGRGAPYSISEHVTGSCMNNVRLPILEFSLSLHAIMRCTSAQAPYMEYAKEFSASLYTMLMPPMVEYLPRRETSTAFIAAASDCMR